MSISAKRFKYLDLETNVPVADFFGINHNDILNGAGEFLTSILGGILPDITEIINDLGDFFSDFSAFDSSQLGSLVGSDQLRDITSSLNALFPSANVSVSDLDAIRDECLGYIYDELRRCSSFTDRFGAGSGYGGSGYIDNCNVDAVGALFSRLGRNTFNYTQPLRGSNNPYINYNPEGCQRLAFYSGLLRTAQSLGIEGTDAVTAQLNLQDQVFVQAAMRDLDFTSGFIASEGGGGYDIKTRDPLPTDPCLQTGPGTQPSTFTEASEAVSTDFVNKATIMTKYNSSNASANYDLFTVVAMLYCKLYKENKTPFINVSPTMSGSVRTKYTDAINRLRAYVTSIELNSFINTTQFLAVFSSICPTPSLPSSDITGLIDFIDKLNLDFNNKTNPGYTATLADGDPSASSNFLDNALMPTHLSSQTVVALLYCKFYRTNKTPFIKASKNMDASLKDQYKAKSLKLVTTITESWLSSYIRDSFFRTYYGLCGQSDVLSVANIPAMVNFVKVLDQDLHTKIGA